MSPIRWLNLARLISMLWVVATTSAMAQDVIVSALAQDEGEPALDQLPELRKALKVTFPAELRENPDVGYVTVRMMIDEKGKISRLPFESTLLAYRMAFLQGAPAAGMQFKPAKRGGKDVPAFVRMAVIFNPASAALGRPDGTPRLLDATTVVDPQLKEHADPLLSRVVWGTVSISESGVPLRVSDVAPGVQPLIEKALRSWKFAPARRGGQPVEASLAIPFIIVPPVEEADRTVARKAIRRVPPVYPLELRKSGIRGEVLLEFIVDAKGRVKDPHVVRSLNPYFDQAALAAIREWRYESSKEDGPSDTRMLQPISFTLSDEPDGGETGVAIRRKADLSKLPEELRYDVAPKLVSYVAPVYPYELLRNGVSGNAQVGYVVSPDGRVVASSVTNAEPPELGLALQAAVGLFVYEAALKGGRPIRSVSGFHQEFSTSDELLIPAHDRAALRLEKKAPAKILKRSSLDGPVVPTKRQEPIYPAALAANPIPGEAVVEFLVDEQGRVCLPRIVSASEPSFGYAAVQATVQWRFKPPTSGGLPAVTRVRVPIVFKIPGSP